MFTETQLAAAVQCPTARAVRWLPHLQKAMQRFGITTARRAAAFLAQLGHESAGLSRIEENLNYSAGRLLEIFPKHINAGEAASFARQPERLANRVYANRMGNGKESSGDGWKFRGRGPIQVTGRENYRWIGTMLGVSLEDQPGLLLDLEFGAASAAAFWRGKGLNAVADAGDILSMSCKVNFCTVKLPRVPVGLADRIERTKRANAALGVS